jgi:hypothetical protein
MDRGCCVGAERFVTRATGWADAVVAGDAGPLQAAFSAQGAHGPTLTWRPTRDDLQPQPLQFLLTYWTQLRKGKSLPRASDIDPLEMQPALGYILLLDVLEDGLDFQFRLFGTIIAAVSGFDMTGRLMSGHPASPYVVDFYRATHRAVLQRREPLATVHSPPVGVSTTVWHRLILPLGDANGAVVRLLGGIVPVARNGVTLTSGW